MISRFGGGAFAEAAEGRHAREYKNWSLKRPVRRAEDENRVELWTGRFSDQFHSHSIVAGGFDEMS